MHCFLDSRFHAVEYGFRMIYQWNLDSKFQRPGFRMPQQKFVRFRIPQLSKNFPDCGTRIPFHGANCCLSNNIYSSRRNLFPITEVNEHCYTLSIRGNLTRHNAIAAIKKMTIRATVMPIPILVDSEVSSEMSGLSFPKISTFFTCRNDMWNNQSQCECDRVHVVLS